MTDVPPGIDNPIPTEATLGDAKTKLPQPLPIPLGEYGRVLEKLWLDFEKIRNDGFYAMDENMEIPRFSQDFIFHGFGGRDITEQIPEEIFTSPNGIRIVNNRRFHFAPPDINMIAEMCKLGILSSDIEFGEYNFNKSTEEETSGCADFWIQPKPFSSYADFLAALPKATYHYFNLDMSRPEPSATLEFVFDKSRPGLKLMIEKAMVDTQPKDSLWPNKIGATEYIEFPNNSGYHLAIPVGLPANYIEYIVFDEQSPYWQEERLQQLRQAAIVDGHPIPLVSVRTGQVIK